MTKRYKIFISAMAGLILLLSGAPYVGYLAVRNKILAHHKWTHVTPDDVIHVWAMGMIGKLPGGLNRAMYLANPGGTIYFSGSIAQNTSFTTKSSMSLIGSGAGDPNSQGCAATITTTLSSGDLFPVTNMNHIYIAHLCIVFSGTGAANAFDLDYGQYVTLEHMYIYGPFATAAIRLHTSSTSTGSTIRNNFNDIHISGLANNASCFVLDSSDSTVKTINGNNFFNVGCSSGTGGNAFWLTNTNQAQIINENLINCAQCTAPGGTAIKIDQGATADTVILASNLEGSTNGFVKATANTVSWYGGGIQSNGTNVTDAQPIFTSFFNTRVGGTLQTLGVTPAGGLYVDGIGMGAGTPISNAMNGAPGWTGRVGGATLFTANTTSFQLAQALNSNEIAAPACSASQDFLWGDSTAHRLKMCNNNGTAKTVAAAESDTFTSPTFSSGVGADGSGFKHKRFGGICTTGAAAGNSCTTAVTWTTAFADANYTVNCTGNTVTQTPALAIESKIAAGITLRVTTFAAAAATYASVDCMAVHD